MVKSFHIHLYIQRHSRYNFCTTQTKDLRRLFSLTPEGNTLNKEKRKRRKKIPRDFPFFFLFSMQTSHLLSKDNQFSDESAFIKNFLSFLFH